ncbi:MAG TPA: hypothetical protein VK485_08670 [Sphingomicrobium sp.]|nr:hypothetical protein [Sphingomicrobium sp.]
MTRALLLGAAAAAATLAFTAPASAQFFNWQTIGYKTVSGGTDRDTIRVHGGRRYHSLRLCSFNAPIRMLDFDIRYENGGHQDVQVRDLIRAGSCTRAIDLRGNRRDIRQIRLVYGQILRSAHRPLVRVQAR